MKTLSDTSLGHLLGKIKTKLDGKQDLLTAGKYITLSGNTIASRDRFQALYEEVANITVTEEATRQVDFDFGAEQADTNLVAAVIFVNVPPNSGSGTMKINCPYNFSVNASAGFSNNDTYESTLCYRFDLRQSYIFCEYSKTFFVTPSTSRSGDNWMHRITGQNVVSESPTRGNDYIAPVRKLEILGNNMDIPVGTTIKIWGIRLGDVV